MKNIFLKIKRKIRAKKRKKGSVKIFSYKAHRIKGNVINIGKLNILFVFIFITLILVAILWGGLGIFKLYKFQPNPAYKDFITADKSEWGGQTKLSILVIGQDKRKDEFGFSDCIMVVIINPYEKSIGIFNINPDIQVYVSKLGRNVKLRNLYNLGILEGEEPPINYMISGVENLLSVKVNRYIVFSEEGLKEMVDILGGVYINNSFEVKDNDVFYNFYLPKGSYKVSGNDFIGYLSADDDGAENKFLRQINGMQNILKKLVGYVIFFRFFEIINCFENNIQTNLTKNEMIKLWFVIRDVGEVRSGYTKFSSLQKIEIDGEILYKPIIEKLDNDISLTFQDRKAVLEQARIEIFNSTNIRGLGALRARWLKNIGLDVIRIGDTEEIYEKTTIYTKERDKYLNTIKAIKLTFDEDIEVKEGEIPDIICTGDVIIILGKNAQN